MTETKEELFYGYCIMQPAGETGGVHWKDSFWNNSSYSFVEGFKNATFYETKEEAEGQMKYENLTKFCRVIGE